MRVGALGLEVDEQADLSVHGGLDKAVYAYVPDMIRYYLNQEPILSNVPTYQCGRDEDRAYVLDHLDELVVKPANESGGYGIIIGPKATAEELEQCAKEIRNDHELAWKDIPRS